VLGQVIDAIDQHIFKSHPTVRAIDVFPAS
jgi:hypothetical protein